jgi:hypothetical protein
VLHPRHKLNYFKRVGWEDNWITMARKIVHDEFERSYADLDLVEDEPELIIRILILTLARNF